MSETDIGLPKLTQEELNAVIEQHDNFLNGKPGGARAVVQDTDLTGLSLAGRNLSQSDFSGSVLAQADLVATNFESATLFGCDFEGADMMHTRLVNADMRGVDAEGADLTGADLTNADLRDGQTVLKRKKKNTDGEEGNAGTVCFANANLTGAKLQNVVAINADFSDAMMADAKLSGADFRESSFAAADMSNADLTGTDIRDCNLRGGIMTGAMTDAMEKSGADFTLTLTDQNSGKEFEEVDLSLDELIEMHVSWVGTAGKQGKQLDLTEYDLRPLENLSNKPLTAMKALQTTFAGMDMTGAEMQGAKLDGSDFRNCILKSADLRGASLKGAIFNRTDLTNANLTPLVLKNAEGEARNIHCNLEGASLRNADLTGAQLRSAQMHDCDLAYAKLMDADIREADFTGAKLKGADFTNALDADAIFADNTESAEETSEAEEAVPA